MSTVSPKAEAKTPDTKPQRVLACVLCQTRKVKCDRKYPCAVCVKSRVQCVPATQVTRRRRRRFPERELLDRLRKYEDLLRHNHIKFEPLHQDPAAEKESPNVEGNFESDDDQSKATTADWPTPSTSVNSERVYEAKSIWHAMNQEDRDPDNNSNSSADDMREVTIKKAWEQLFDHNDHLLFGSRQTAVDVSTLHPEPVQIFRLWQLYLENVDPLVKVTHTPSLQGKIIEAASNVSKIMPTLEALMFSIYCMSTLSLDEADCQATFGMAKRDLLTKYQFGCQQALSNCGFLRTNDRDCLTALYLYLVSVRSTTVPQSLSSMLGVAIRIAQRMGIDSEASLARCTAFEAEMRRRLWWSLALFDARIGELSAFKSTALNPTWDCRIPLNVNDSDLLLEMKEPPHVQGKSTEALFAVVRSELGDFIRNTNFHLDFTTPALKAIAKDLQHNSSLDDSELTSLENIIEEKYLKYCVLDKPLHFMTNWMARGYLAKSRLMERLSRYTNSSMHQTDTQRDTSMLYALRMLECDTKIMTSPLTKGFIWLVHSYFPFTAYIHTAQNIKRRPTGEQVGLAWEIMSSNHDARFGRVSREDVPIHSPFFKIFANVILQAWEPCEAAFKQSGKPLVTPRIVSSVRETMTRLTQYRESPDAGQSGNVTNTGMNQFPMSIPIGFGVDNLLYNMGGQGSYAVTGFEAYPYNMPGLEAFNVDASQLDWSSMDWDLVAAPNDETGQLQPTSS